MPPLNLLLFLLIPYVLLMMLFLLDDEPARSFPTRDFHFNLPCTDGSGGRRWGGETVAPSLP